jgi:hypothetical protein
MQLRLNLFFKIQSVQHQFTGGYFMKRFISGSLLLFVTCTMGSDIKDGMVFGSFEANNGRKIAVKFERGSNYLQKKRFGVANVNIPPQIAVWMEDTLGKYLGTAYVTKFFGKQEGKYIKSHPDSCFRTMCMPYWLNRFIAAGNAAPTAGKPLPDAVTGATPAGSFTVNITVPDSITAFNLLAEWNRSFDSNKTYTKEQSSFNGQPSVVFSAHIDFSDTARTTDTLKLIGRGGETGSDGKLYSDTDKLTTALSVFRGIVAERK